MRKLKAWPPATYKKHWLTHHPIHPCERWGRKNIHGHVHSKSLPDENYINVSVEAAGPSILVNFDDIRNGAYTTFDKVVTVIPNSDFPQVPPRGRHFVTVGLSTMLLFSVFLEKASHKKILTVLATISSNYRDILCNLIQNRLFLVNFPLIFLKCHRAGDIL